MLLPNHKNAVIRSMGILRFGAAAGMDGVITTFLRNMIATGSKGEDLIRAVGEVETAVEARRMTAGGAPTVRPITIKLLFDAGVTNYDALAILGSMEDDLIRARASIPTAKAKKLK